MLRISAESRTPTIRWPELHRHASGCAGGRGLRTGWRKQPDRGELAIWWRGIVRRVKDALRAVGLIGERTTEEEFNRVLDAIATGMRNGRKPGRRVMESWHEAPAYSKSGHGDVLFSLGAATADHSSIGQASRRYSTFSGTLREWARNSRLICSVASGVPDSPTICGEKLET